MTLKLATSPHIKVVLGTIGDINVPDYDGGFYFLHAETDKPEFEYVECPPEDAKYECPACHGTGSDTCIPDMGYVTLHDCPELPGGDDEQCPGDGEWTCVACRGSGVNPELRWTVYRGLIERITWPNWRSVADSTGQDPYHYTRIMLDPDYVADDALTEAAERMRVIEDVAGHSGWYEFDQYPLSLSYTEIQARYEGFDPDSLACKAREQALAGEGI